MRIPLLSNRDEVTTSTSELTHHSHLVLSEGSLPELIGSEAMPILSTMLVPHLPSIIQLSLSTNEYAKGFDTANTTDELSRSSSVWGVTTSA